MVILNKDGLKANMLTFGNKTFSEVKMKTYALFRHHKDQLTCTAEEIDLLLKQSN